MIKVKQRVIYQKRTLFFAALLFVMPAYAIFIFITESYIPLNGILLISAICCVPLVLFSFIAIKLNRFRIRDTIPRLFGIEVIVEDLYNWSPQTYQQGPIIIKTRHLDSAYTMVEPMILWLEENIKLRNWAYSKSFNLNYREHGFYIMKHEDVLAFKLMFTGWENDVK